MSSELLGFLLDDYEGNKPTAQFASIRRALSELIYGGHILNRNDQQLLGVMLNRFCCSEVLRPGHALSPSGEFRMPLQDGSRMSWLRAVETLPISAPLEFLGLHESASVEKNRKETSELLSAVSRAEGTGSNRDQRYCLEETVSRVTEFLSMIPAEMEHKPAQETGVRSDATLLAVILVRESKKYELLIRTIRMTLNAVCRMYGGRGVWCPRLATMGLEVASDQIPPLWSRYSYLSNRRLTPYIQDLRLRSKFMNAWQQQIALPLIWLSALFSPLAFSSAIRLDYANGNNINIFNINMRFCLLQLPEDQQTSTPIEAPVRGAYIKGVFIQSARWDSRRRGLVECLPKAQITTAPVVWFEPTSATCTTCPSIFACPLYKTGSRHSAFYTTSQSTNYVMCIDMPSPLSPAHWIERGTAMLLQPE